LAEEVEGRREGDFHAKEKYKSHIEKQRERAHFVFNIRKKQNEVAIKRH
jgi:hypothetical protein